MNRFLIALLPFFFFSCSHQQVVDEADLKLWYETPANATVSDSPNG